MSAPHRSSPAFAAACCCAAALLLAATGCGDDAPADEPSDATSGAAQGGAASVGTGGAPQTGGAGGGGSEEVAPECAPPGPSNCSVPNEASVIRGVARLAPGMAPPGGASGRLVIGLMHARFGKEENGGHPHWYDVIPDVDLAAGPVPFEIDMCDGDAEMWSEDNCEFNLVVVLDTNGNNGPAAGVLNLIPDPGEVGWHQVFDLSCKGTSQCFDVRFDCLDGQACISYEDLGTCKCAVESCDSQSVACSP
jgi:hypothetical protein